MTAQTRPGSSRSSCRDSSADYNRYSMSDLLEELEDDPTEILVADIQRKRWSRSSKRKGGHFEESETDITSELQDNIKVLSQTKSASHKDDLDQGVKNQVKVIENEGIREESVYENCEAVKGRGSCLGKPLPPIPVTSGKKENLKSVPELQYIPLDGSIKSQKAKNAPSNGGKQKRNQFDFSGESNEYVRASEGHIQPRSEAVDTYGVCSGSPFKNKTAQQRVRERRANMKNKKKESEPHEYSELGEIKRSPVVPGEVKLKLSGVTLDDSSTDAKVYENVDFLKIRNSPPKMQKTSGSTKAKQKTVTSSDPRPTPAEKQQLTQWQLAMSAPTDGASDAAWQENFTYGLPYEEKEASASWHENSLYAKQRIKYGDGQDASEQTWHENSLYGTQTRECEQDASELWHENSLYGTPMKKQEHGLVESRHDSSLYDTQTAIYGQDDTNWFENSLYEGGTWLHVDNHPHPTHQWMSPSSSSLDALEIPIYLDLEDFSPTDPQPSETSIYEPIMMKSPVDDDLDDVSWGSSEFEEYEDVDQLVQGRDQSIQRSEEKHNQESSPSNLLHNLAAKLRKGKDSESIDDTVCIEVDINLSKHPPPKLPPEPEKLSTLQVKRRNIIASVVQSEASYVESLSKIIEHYEKPLRAKKPHMMSKSDVRRIFYKVRDILQCHRMFSIELAEVIKQWDEKEQIGHCFTASFSKAIVFEVYSDYVNNFSLAMETAKRVAKKNHLFAEFLKDKMLQSQDRLSFFGLMVKPVQRFPQFILLLQDLLKYTPVDHADRLPLQMALTELEGLTHKLNEMKRISESMIAMKNIEGRFTSKQGMKTNPNRHLIREDSVIQVKKDETGEEIKRTNRKLFMFSDILVCATSMARDGSLSTMERLKIKWCEPIEKVKVLDAAVKSMYSFKNRPNGPTVVSRKMSTTSLSDNPHLQHLDDMLHDLPLLERICQLVSKLRLEYQELTSEVVSDAIQYLQFSIRQEDEINCSTLQLVIPGRGSTGTLLFRMASPEVKEQWIHELRRTKLAHDASNQPGWYLPETELSPMSRRPLFMKPLPVDVTREDAKVHCAVPVLLPTYDDKSVGTQHLWVCSSGDDSSRVTIVSLHHEKPHVVESFEACDGDVSHVEVVPGFATTDKSIAFAADTIWMVTTRNRVLIFRAADTEHRKPALGFTAPGRVTSIRYLDGRIYMGLFRGALLIYARDNDGMWVLDDPLRVDLGMGPVNYLLPIEHHIWAACGHEVLKTQVTTNIDDVGKDHVDLVRHQVAGEVSCVVKAGAGLLMSFAGQPDIAVYQLEDFEHLQTVSVAAAVNKVLPDPQGEPTYVTTLLASRGLLWIGTNVGCILSLGLPRLEGIPKIKGRPSVSYHAHLGPVRFIVPIYCHPTALFTDTDCVSDPADQIPKAEGNVQLSSSQKTHEVKNDGKDELGLKSQSSEGQVNSDEVFSAARQLLPTGGEQCSTSTPDLRFTGNPQIKEDVRDIYHDLMQNSEGIYEQEVFGVKVKKKLLTFKEKWKETVSDRIIQKKESFNRKANRSMPPMKIKRSKKGSVKDDAIETVPEVIYGNLSQGRESTESDITGNRSSLEDKDNSLNHSPFETHDHTPNRSSLDDKESPCNQSSIEDKDNSIPLDQSQSNVTETSEVQNTPVKKDKPSLPKKPRIFRGKDDSDETANDMVISSPIPSASVSVSNNQQSGFVTVTSGTESEGHSGSLSPSSTAKRSHVPKHQGSQSVVMVTGGEGHINWHEKTARDCQYEDVCLLLWLCPE